MENYFRDYIKDPIYEAAVKVLMGTLLFEMAYNRKDAISKIQVIASRLAEKMVMVHHANSYRDISHWKTSLNGHLKEIHKATYLVGGKRLPDADIRMHVFSGPFGEYNDYRLHHEGIDDVKADTEFSPHTPDDYAAIKRKYDRLIPLLAHGASAPKYVDLLDS